MENPSADGEIGTGGKDTMETPEVWTERLDHLGIVAGVCQEIGPEVQRNGLSAGGGSSAVGSAAVEPDRATGPDTWPRRIDRRVCRDGSGTDDADVTRPEFCRSGGEAWQEG